MRGPNTFPNVSRLSFVLNNDFLVCSIFNASSVYHTSNMSEILHIIMEPSLAMISHIVQDSFDFKNRLDKDCPNGSTLSTCDIKSFYNNVKYDLFYTAVEY